MATTTNQYQKALYFLEKAHDALAIVRDNDPSLYNDPAFIANAGEEEAKEDPMLAGILQAREYVKAQQAQEEGVQKWGAPL